MGEAFVIDGVRYVSVAEWAATWAVAPRTVRRWCDEGRIEGLRRGRNWSVRADALAPNTTPAHMRPPGRVVAGEVVTTGGPRPGQAGPTGTAVAVPEAPLHTPEAPPALFRPFVTLDDLAAMCGGVVSRRTLAAMLAEGEIPGGLKRGHGGGWIVPAAEVRRLIGGGSA